MRTLTIISIATALTFKALGQENPTARAQPIVAEGKRLYNSEIASWYGTDLFIEKYTDKQNIGGYFSYMDNGIAKCIFFSKSEKPKVIGAISFDSTYNTQTASVDLKERDFTTIENDYYAIRKLAITEVQTDTLFKTYNNTKLNLIPLINGNERKVYILTGPNKSGVVIFGNDYLLTFDNQNKLTSKKQLHKNIIPIGYGSTETNGQIVLTTVHSHLPETGEFITATDICTLMLYSKFAKWKTHNVISKEYLNVWDCETNELNVFPMSMVEKMLKNNGQQKKQE